MTTTFVHIEIVLSMDTGSCVLGLKTFNARRSTPSVVWSENGTVFVGAEKEFLLCVQSWNRQAPLLIVHKGIKRKYNLLARRIMVGLGQG